MSNKLGAVHSGGMANASYESGERKGTLQDPQGVGSIMFGNAQNPNGTLQSSKEFLASRSNAGKADAKKYLDYIRKPQTTMANGKKPKSEYIGDDFSINKNK